MEFIAIISYQSQLIRRPIWGAMQIQGPLFIEFISKMKLGDQLI